MATEFCVLENGRPACYPTGAKCWHSWKFKEYDQAFKYAKDWLGVYGQGLTPEMLPVGGTFTYNGYDRISIKELDIQN